MAGFTTDEGQEYIADLIYAAGTQETYTMGLFVNAAGTLTTSSVWANVTQPSGTGYAEKTLVAGTFVVDSGGEVTYPQQQWTASDDWTGGDIQGYYIRNNAGTPRLIHVQYRDDAGFSMLTGRVYTVDLSVVTT